MRQTFISRILHVFTALFGHFLTFGRRVGWKKVWGIVIVAVILFYGARAFLFKNSVEAIQENTTPSVEVAAVSDLANAGSPLQIVGTVSSVSQATVNAQSSGAVTAVYRELGNFVSAGVVVAELGNASERASVLQAQASVDSAQAGLDKVQGPSSNSAKETAVNTLLSSYGTFDSAVRGTADTMISNPDTVSPQFKVRTNNSQLPNNISNARVAMGDMWKRQSARAKTLNANDDLASELKVTLDEVRQARTMFDNIIQALNSAIPSDSVSQSDIDGFLSAATAARTSLTSALSSLSSAQTTLTNSAQGGGADVASAQAQLKSAQGMLAAARANLEKTILRAPISGTINSFSLKLGDFVSMNSPVLTIANNDALEVVTYITSGDTADVTVGKSVSIEGGNTGVITHVAPAIDPLTKKIEVRIGISRNSNLTNGQSVLINLPHKVVTPTTKNTRLTIPINAIKIGASDTVVFTVSASSTLEAHPVVLGELLGDRVVITSGLTSQMQIVVDARGLRDGQKVELLTAQASR